MNDSNSKKKIEFLFAQSTVHTSCSAVMNLLDTMCVCEFIFYVILTVNHQKINRNGDEDMKRQREENR